MVNVGDEVGDEAIDTLFEIEKQSILGFMTQNQEIDRFKNDNYFFLL
jgi:hypothetical protein